MVFSYFYTVFLIASTGVAELDNTLNTLKVVCAGVIALIGAIILLMGIYSVATAWYQHDMSQMPGAIQRVVAGVIMLFSGAIVALFI